MRKAFFVEGGQRDVSVLARMRFGACAYGVKVHFDATDVGRADGDHAEETVSPSTEESDPFVEHEQVLKTFSHVWGDRKQFPWDWR